MPDPISIPGLPEGVLCVRFGVPKGNEYSLSGGRIEFGSSGVQAMIVTPAEGYEFAYHVIENTYYCRPKGQPIKVTAHFSFADEMSSKIAMERIRKMTGFVDLKTS